MWVWRVGDACMRVHDSAVMPMSGMRVGGDARTVSPRMWAEASDTMWHLGIPRVFSVTKTNHIHDHPHRRHPNTVHIPCPTCKVPCPAYHGTCTKCRYTNINMYGASRTAHTCSRGCEGNVRVPNDVLLSHRRSHTTPSPEHCFRALSAWLYVESDH